MDMNLMQGDCLELMASIPDGSVDMILCDLPYGTTACKWDSVIPFEPLWAHYKRVIKDRGAIVLTASQPFTSKLVMSQPKWFRYEWIWQKTMPTQFLDAKRKPLKKHESILVFGKQAPVYYPQMRPGKPYQKKRKVVQAPTYNNVRAFDTVNTGERYPVSVIEVPNGNYKSKHSTQKPVALMEYLIKTYTLEGETVLDNCMGSGTTCVACVNTGRDFIGIEKDPGYFEIAQSRIIAAMNEPKQLNLTESV
jgi:site-specific DNA-methyltransferase (adenine-specific)